MGSPTTTMFANDHGPATFDRTHAVTLLHNWELPFGKGRRYLYNASKAVDAVAGGWRFSGVTTLYSGVAFTPTISNVPLWSTPTSTTSVPTSSAIPMCRIPSADLWFNPAAYTAPQAPYRNGDASKGSLRGPALFVLQSVAVEGIRHRREQDARISLGEFQRLQPRESRSSRQHRRCRRRGTDHIDGQSHAPDANGLAFSILTTHAACEFSSR